MFVGARHLHRGRSGSATMSQFRSEDMTLVQLFIQSEAAHDTLHRLGEINEGQGCIQFKDENSDKSAFQRLFVSDVRRCDDMLRILRLFKELVAKEKKLQGSGRDEKQLSLHELHDRLLEVEKEMKSHGNAYLLLQKQNNDLKVLCTPTPCPRGPASHACQPRRGPNGGRGLAGSRQSHSAPGADA